MTKEKTTSQSPEEMAKAAQEAAVKAAMEQAQSMFGNIPGFQMPEGIQEQVMAQMTAGIPNMAEMQAQQEAMLKAAGIDMETEAEIQRHLRELDEQKTIVTIAHRISSVKDSDLILVLEHGRIVERGTHDELVAAHGRYWEIYYRQLGLQAGRSQGFEA